jgi:mono/diheme cytochrome c family protein
MLNIVIGVVLIAAAAFFCWAGFRAWRAKKRLVKWAGAGAAALLAAVASLLIAVTVAGLFKLHARTAPIPDLKVVATPERLLRGEAIASSFCDGCHSKTGPLTGGFDVGKDIAVPIGSFVSSNLTPAGDLSRWSDGEIFRAIRNGVDADGHWLVIMSYTSAGHLSDDDINALIAYIRTRPAAGQPTANPPDALSPLGFLMLGAGLLPAAKPIITGTIHAPPKSRTAQYGEYILSYQDCRECHGHDLSGGVAGQLAPIGPGLSLVKDWKPEDFVTAMRSGVDPGGHELSDQMPWRQIGQMDDDELGAIYEYLTHLPGS